MSDAFVASYRVGVPESEAAERAEAILLEQTVELPRAALFEPFVLEEILPELVGLDALDEATTRVRIAYPLVTSALDAAQLVNVLFGNVSLLPDVELVDVELPLALRVALGGPRFGIDGLRAAAVTHEGALTATALKPMGLAPKELAARATTLGEAGLDLVKDDHGLGDHPFCPFDARVRAVGQALADVSERRGRPLVYAPHVSGTPSQVARQLELAVKAGAGAILACPMLMGLPVFHELCRAQSPLPVIAHPAFAGATRIAPPLLLGTLLRALGADGVIFPHHGGRFAYSRDTCTALAARLREGGAPLLPSLPLPAGGMSVERAGELVAFYGSEVMLLIGGSLYLAGERLGDRARAFVESVAEASRRARSKSGADGESR